MANTAEIKFKEIVLELTKIEGVEAGTMMSSPGIQYKKKNFVFLWDDKMCFRLGRDFEPSSEGIHKYELLNPFKTKPPLKDWFVLTDQSDKWHLLAQIAYEKMKSKVG